VAWFGRLWIIFSRLPPTPVTAFVAMRLGSSEAQAVIHALGCFGRAFYDGGCYDVVKFIQVFLLDLVAEPMTD